MASTKAGASYDEEQGFVLRDVLSDQNDPLSYVIEGDEWKRERIEGRVVIKWWAPRAG
jgi:hypothetical protein